jgi:hypothetical protein
VLGGFYEKFEKSFLDFHVVYNPEPEGHISNFKPPGLEVEACAESVSESLNI